MESIEKHIEKDKELLQDPTLSPQMRRHTADELEHLERYHKEHQKIIMILRHLKCIVMRILMLMSVEFMKTRPV